MIMYKCWLISQYFLDTKELDIMANFSGILI